MRWHDASMDDVETRERKDAMRREALARRTSLGSAGRAAASAAIAEHVQASSWWSRARTLSAFVGVRDEPDTSALLRHALHNGKRVVVPRIASRNQLVFADITDVAQLQPSTFGLLEPPADRGGTPLVDAAVDLVLVPGLLFDRGGHRVGYGRGYYDRALQPLPPTDVLRVGLVFAACLQPVGESVPRGPNDVAVQHVVTEHGVHNVGH
ncbi:MAG: 5-formyltetrahydrofolate cyclo-ligase [Myxococcales bacterium FL481]|nr:MAG: 5-formyltetrahydrofolate cyclo-ligase [Myxococcales bacterium FL481]